MRSLKTVAFAQEKLTPGNGASSSKRSSSRSVSTRLRVAYGYEKVDSKGLKSIVCSRSRG